MIEKTLYQYLKNAGLSANVYMEQPKVKPSYFYLMEKTGASIDNQITTSTVIIQSYAKTLAEAAAMSEEIVSVMLQAITIEEITNVSLNNDYNFTDSATKQYRYQALFTVTHY